MGRTRPPRGSPRFTTLSISGAAFAGFGDNSAEASYYTWVDQHNTLGLGNDVSISTGNENDALLALVTDYSATSKSALSMLSALAAALQSLEL